MALLFFDGFETYTNVASMQEVWWSVDSVTTPISTGGRLNSAYIEVDTSDPNLIAIPISSATLHFGIAVKLVNQTSSDDIFTLYNNGTAVFNLHTNGDGTWACGNGSSTTDLTGTTTSSGLTPTGEWHYVEVKVFLHDTTGTAEIWIDGVSEASGTSLDTLGGSNATINYIQIQGSSSSMGMDDLYILDDTGSDNNDRLDQPIIRAMYPVADTAQEDWALSTGSDSFDLTDDVPPVHTTYLSTSTVTDKTDLEMTNIAGSFENVYGVQTFMWTEGIDSVSRGVTLSVKQGSSTGNDGETSVGSGTDISVAIHEQDPDTSSAWTTAGLDTMQIRIDLTRG